MAQEIERKFRLAEPPGWLPRYEASQIRQGYLAVSEDTEVRLRETEGRRLLTVKQGHGEVRREVEVELERAQFDALWPLTESRRVLKTRQRVPLNHERTAEVDVYAGDLEGLVVAEVEFRSQSEADRFEAPDWLGEEVTGDRRFENQFLAAGEDAATGAAAIAGKAGMDRRQDSGDDSGHTSRAYRLKKGEGARKGIRRIALGRLDHALEQLSCAGDGELPAAIHGARKDLKKLRAVLRLVRVSIGEATYRAENERYREAGRMLSTARDAEVKLQTLSLLEERYEGELPAIARFRSQLHTERRERKADMDAAVTAIESGRPAIENLRMKRRGWKLVEPGLSRSYRAGREAMRSAKADSKPENVHEWRKRSKDLWYHLRIVQRAWPELIGETSNRAHVLADLLGDYHDLSVLAEDATQRSFLSETPEQRAILFALIRKRQEELLKSAFALGKRLYAEKPKAFSRRYAAYWRAPAA